MAVADWAIWPTLAGWFTQPMLKELLTGAVGALLGAWGGAHAIQRISERTKQEEALRKEVLRTNAAIGEVYRVANTLFGLKGQFFRPMAEKYKEIDDIVQEIEKARIEKRPPQKVLPALMPEELGYAIIWPQLTLDRLDKIVSEELGVLGRPPALVGALVQDVADLETLIKERNALIDKLKSMARGGGLTKEQHALMFGLPNADGGADLTFKSTVRGIVSKADASIHFSLLLSKDLFEHGNRIRERYLRRFRGAIPRITQLNFDGPKAKGLFPDPTPFKTWETNFAKRPEPTRGRRFAKFGWALRKAWRWLLLKPWGRWKKKQKYKMAMRME